MRPLAVLTAAFLLAAPDASAQLFKCVQDGKTVYQQEKCPETAKESTVRAPTGPAKDAEVQKADEEKQVQQTEADLERIAEVVAGYNMCTEFQKDFRDKYAAAYNDWGTKNREAFKKYEATPEAVAKMKRRTAEYREKLSGEGIEAEAKKQALCARILGIIQQQ
jgi:hypothetical protein